MRRVAILGAGGMGTAMALLHAHRTEMVHLWAREPELAESIRRTRENARYLPSVKLPENLLSTNDAAQACAEAELIVAAIPSAFLRSTLSTLALAIPPDVPVISVIKGIENQTFALPSRIIQEVLGARPLAVLSGPSHAEELARGLPASVVVAGEDEELNVAIRDQLSRGMFRVYSNPDRIGVELAGALKNVMAIAAGVCEGLALGDNAKAALLTRGLTEITRFGEARGASRSTFFGLAGVGDLLTTCYSKFSRNRHVGEQLGRGRTLEEVLASMTNVAEGVTTCRSVHQQALANGIDMPITRELHAVMFEKKPPRDALTDLMLRAPKDEWELA